MNQTSRRAFIVAAAATAAAGPALAQANKSVSCDKVFVFLENYLKIPAAERDRFILAYYLRIDGQPPKGLNAWLGAGAERIPVPIAADGRVQRLPTLAQLKAKTPLVFDVPDSTKFSLSMTIEPVARPAAEMKAADLAAAVAQAAKGAKKAAGLLGAVAPKMESVTFRGVAAGTVVHANGSTSALPLVKGQPVFQPGKLKTAAILKFAKAPAQMMIGPAA